MPRRPAAYPPASREQIIALARDGRISKELAQEFDPSKQTIRNGIFQAEADRVERPGALTSDEREELSRWRRCVASSACRRRGARVAEARAITTHPA
jgi:hypothetical protein